MLQNIQARQAMAAADHKSMAQHSVCRHPSKGMSKMQHDVAPQSSGMHNFETMPNLHQKRLLVSVGFGERPRSYLIHKVSLALVYQQIQLRQHLAALQIQLQIQV